MSWWPTEPGEYTDRRPSERRYLKARMTSGAFMAAYQWTHWKCWLEVGRRRTKVARKVA